MTDSSLRPAALSRNRDLWAALILLALSLITRLVYGALAGTANDETYYWQWSRHLDLSYYDQGPGIAYCIRLGTLLFGPTTFGVRFVSILIGTATAALTYTTAARWLGSRVALITLALLSAAPLLFIGGILATYDGPQAFCWIAALYALTVTVQDERAGGWYVVGIFAGLGLLCKLTMALFLPCVLLFLALSPRYRHWLRSPHPYLAMVLALLLFSPVIVWSMKNGWTTVLHAQALSSRSRGAAPGRWLGEFLGSQVLVIGPFLFLAELFILGKWIRVLRRDVGENLEARRFLFSFSVPILALCLLIALRSKLEANWPAPMHLTGLMAVALWFTEVWKRRRGLRGLLIAAPAFSALMTVVILFPTLVTSAGIRVSADLAQKANETYGWQPLMADIQKAREQLEAEGKPVFLAGINYRVPSLLAFHLPDHPETAELFLASRHDQYWFWTQPQNLIGQNCLLCLDDPKPEAIANARICFASVEELPTVTVFRPGFNGAVKTWRLYACRDFRGYDPSAWVQGY